MKSMNDAVSSAVKEEGFDVRPERVQEVTSSSFSLLVVKFATRIEIILSGREDDHGMLHG